MAQQWLICYDIREPRRLQRVHKYCCDAAMAVQLSVFVAAFSRAQRLAFVRGLEALINEREDDVRLYPIGDINQARLLGTSRLPPMVEAMIQFQQQPDKEGHRR